MSKLHIHSLIMSCTRLFVGNNDLTVTRYLHILQNTFTRVANIMRPDQTALKYAISGT